MDSDLDLNEISEEIWRPEQDAVSIDQSRGATIPVTSDANAERITDESGDLRREMKRQGWVQLAQEARACSCTHRTKPDLSSVFGHIEGTMLDPLQPCVLPSLHRECHPKGEKVSNLQEEGNHEEYT
ncbi:hypothetical protein HPP92_025247 [Vanilla planifolia]|uniref:Uncharacterized protein n=1 Tax=Vanilla planifolia TaxID=51239 RepID=A0A835PJL5_VANPL|nr:hypothetical protein HPP92_025247 [Vanilla planifolia]